MKNSLYLSHRFELKSLPFSRLGVDADDAGVPIPCCLRFASLRISMISVANSLALKRASF